MLEESTDCDVTIFSSEEDEDGQLDDNSETNEDGGTRTSGPITHLEWTNTINFKELEKYENLAGPKHSLPVGSSEKVFFELFVTNDFYNKVAEEKKNMQLYHKEKQGQWITNGKTQMWKNPSLYWNSDLYGPC